MFKDDQVQVHMKFKEVYAYDSFEQASRCADTLREEGIESVLSHREKGLFGDPSTSDMTWISVPESDYDRARQILYPPIEEPSLKLQLQCPRCKSLKVKFDIISHKTGLGKIFTWPWDKERFFCEDCRHVWDREPED